MRTLEASVSMIRHVLEHRTVIFNQTWLTGRYVIGCIYDTPITNSKTRFLSIWNHNMTIAKDIIVNSIGSSWGGRQLLLPPHPTGCWLHDFMVNLIIWVKVGYYSYWIKFSCGCTSIHNKIPRATPCGATLLKEQVFYFPLFIQPQILFWGSKPTIKSNNCT